MRRAMPKCKLISSSEMLPETSAFQYRRGKKTILGADNVYVYTVKLYYPQIFRNYFLKENDYRKGMLSFLHRERRCKQN